MSDETKPTHSPGLAGVVAGETAICWVDPNAGLLYRGYDIHEIAGRVSFEEVAWLLLHENFPEATQLAAFKKQLAVERPLPGPVLAALRQLPASAHPMDWLRTAVSMLGAFDPELNDNSHEANLRKATRLIARVSTIVTDGWRVLHNEAPRPPMPELSHAENFLFRLNGIVPEPWRARMLDTILVLYADHEFNASTFSARVTASTLADIYAAATTGCAT
ncbi:MAG: citrate synthase, partial [Verrucomicrobia bacterium]|nr:citrate synthase [Verrucomicrobiota bacterium]